MNHSLLHVYRNTPFGRETLLQSIFFSKRLNLDLSIYVPVSSKFLMYFDHAAVQIDLDSSYLKDPSRAHEHVKEILSEMKADAGFWQPTQYTASNLPDIPSDFDMMSCPRVISDLSSAIRLGRIGSKVRDILLHATFPVLIPSQAFKKWESVCVMFGGSINGVKSLQLGMRIAYLSGVPLDVFTQAEEGSTRRDYEEVLRSRNLEQAFASMVRSWHFQERGSLSSNLFVIPHDALVVMGIFGHGLIKDLFFGNTTEMVQTTLPNSLVLVGPKFQCEQFCSH